MSTSQGQQGSWTGTRRTADGGSDFNTINAIIRRFLTMRGNNTLVQVKAVSGTGLNPVGFVDVQPMVYMQDGSGNTTPHGMVYNLPYMRLQGGNSAVICDPKVDDIGLAVIAGRDQTNVKATRAPAAPGSFRHSDMADGLYLGGFLNAAPAEYIWLTGNGVKVKTAGTFEVDAASMKVNCPISTTGDITADGTVTGKTDTVAGTISGKDHTHPVTAAPGTTGAPE